MSVFPINRVPDILKRMETNSSQPEAMKTCFGILAIMSREENNKILIAREGMETILSIMTLHIDRTDVQESGCDLLWSLAFNSSSVKDIIAKYGGANILVRALKRHSRSSDFLKSACGALSNMCQSKLNQESVSSHGGLQPLVGSIHIHQTNSKLLPFIFDAIASIIVNNEENAKTVSSLGIIPVIVASLSRHKSSMEVVKSGCHTLAILSDVKGQASKIAFAGGVPIILSLLDTHPLYSDLHRVAAVVLLRMLQESSHVGREISCHEGVRILLNSLEKGGAQQDTVAAVTHILYTVTNPTSPSSSAIESQLWIVNKSMTVTGTSIGNNENLFDDNTSDFKSNFLTKDSGKKSSQITDQFNGSVKTTALTGVVQILKQYPNRRDVVRAACRLINNLSSFSNVITALDRLHLLDRLLECLSYHKETKDVIETTSSFIKQLMKRNSISLQANSSTSINGIIHLLQIKSSDEDIVNGCMEGLNSILTQKYSLRSDKIAEIEKNRMIENKPWEEYICPILLKYMIKLLEIEKPIKGLESVMNIYSLQKVSSGSKGLWAKGISKLVSSIITFIENFYAIKNLDSNSTLFLLMKEVLEECIDPLSQKSSEFIKRCEKILSLMKDRIVADNPKEPEPVASISSKANEENAIEVSIEAKGSMEPSQRENKKVSKCNPTSPKPIRSSSRDPSPNVANRSTFSLKAAIGFESSNNNSDNEGTESKIMSFVEKEELSEGENNSLINSSSAKIVKLNMKKENLPKHPLKYFDKCLSEPPRLLENWPSHYERLLANSNNMIGRSFLNPSPSSESSLPTRLSICYQGESAAGKGIHSKCQSPLPYEVPPNGIGEPFEHSLCFDSEFESGNLLMAVQKAENSYDLFLRSDLNTPGHTQWFYFAVSNTHPPELVELAKKGVQIPPVKVVFNIVNLTKPDSLFNMGMRPVIYSVQNAVTNGIGWIRSGSDIAYFGNPYLRNNSAGEGLAYYYTLTFTLEFTNPEDTILVAYSYPYTYSDYKYKINSLLAKPELKNTIRQYKLCQTLSGEDCDLVVITNFLDKDKIGPINFKSLEAYFKEEGSQTKSFGPGRSSKFFSNSIKTLKPALFLSARVHPGETPASWMMKGILEFLTSDCSQAKLLRQVFVIFIIPMLNPDGVIYGNNRCSLAGVDLNRQWKMPMKHLHPTVFSFKSFMIAQKKIRDISMYIDLHGHSRKYNVFMYGCDDKKRPKPAVKAFPKFFSLHNIGKKYVSFSDCSFNVKKGRESTARVVVAKEINIPCSFTLEATFCGSNYGPLKDCHMNIGHLQEVGAALCDAFLNFSISEGQVKDVLLVPSNLKEVHQVEKVIADEENKPTVAAKQTTSKLPEKLSNKPNTAESESQLFDIDSFIGNDEETNSFRNNILSSSLENNDKEELESDSEDSIEDTSDVDSIAKAIVSSKTKSKKNKNFYIASQENVPKGRGSNMKVMRNAGALTIPRKSTSDGIARNSIEEIEGLLNDTARTQSANDSNSGSKVVRVLTASALSSLKINKELISSSAPNSDRMDPNRQKPLKSERGFDIDVSSFLDEQNFHKKSSSAKEERSKDKKPKKKKSISSKNSKKNPTKETLSLSGNSYFSESNYNEDFEVIDSPRLDSFGGSIQSKPIENKKAQGSIVKAEYNPELLCNNDFALSKDDYSLAKTQAAASSFALPKVSTSQNK